MKLSPAIIATYALALMVGVLVTLLLLKQTESAERQARIIKLEADVRTATGKYLDLGEAHTQEIEDAHSAKSMELYALQIKLDACTAAKK
jgi:hypothetical protein